MYLVETEHTGVLQLAGGELFPLQEGRESRGALPFKGSVLQQAFSRGLLSARSRGRLLFKGIMKETKRARFLAGTTSRAFAFSVAAAKRLVL